MENKEAISRIKQIVKLADGMTFYQWRAAQDIVECTFNSKKDQLVFDASGKEAKYWLDQLQDDKYGL